jgi:hypothetical protein
MAVALAFVPEPEAEAELPDVPVERLRRRPRSLGLDPLSRRELSEKKRIDADTELLAALAARPRKRSDCIDGPRPCPWAGCSHHLGIYLTPYGAPKVAFPDGEGGVDVDAMEETCVLDVADAHDKQEPKTYAEVGELTNMTPQRVQQIEQWALMKGRAEAAVPAARSRVALRGIPTRPAVRPSRRLVKPPKPPRSKAARGRR